MKRREILKLAFSSILIAAAPYSADAIESNRIKVGQRSKLNVQFQTFSSRQNLHLTVFNATDKTILFKISDPSTSDTTFLETVNIYSNNKIQRTIPYGYLAEFFTLKVGSNTKEMRYDFIAGIHSESTRTIEFSKDPEMPQEFLISEKIGVKSIS
ncbi:MAG: hypothetical protein PVI90_11370 [Desulfobacteraceae bacterium]|jgi:hypothetical protein